MMFGNTIYSCECSAVVYSDFDFNKCRYLVYLRRQWMAEKFTDIAGERSEIRHRRLS